MIIPFGRWVFREAARQGRKWTERVPDFQMSINMSGYQFADAELTDYMSRILHEVGLPTENVMIEVTETYDIGSGDAQKAIRRMQTAGIRVAMDDFGTGNSSLKVLQESHFDILKLDRYFVARIGDPKAEIILASTIAMAGDLGLEVVAEGVETEEQIRFLLGHQCHLAQGYYYSRPLTKEQYIKWQKVRNSSRAGGIFRERKLHI